MWRALAAIGASLPDDVRIVVIDAVGPSFSAGLDRRVLDGTGVPGEPSLGELADLPSDELVARIAQFQGGFTWLRETPAITIAAVQGHAVGAGFQLALACDLIVCADDARFAMREASLGLVPDLGGTKPLVDAVGYPRALELCVTGRWVGAAEAADLGLAVASVPTGELPAAVDDLVAALLSSPDGAVRATKALLRGANGRSFGEQLAAERTAQAALIRDLAGR